MSLSISKPKAPKAEERLAGKGWPSETLLSSDGGGFVFLPPHLSAYYRHS